MLFLRSVLFSRYCKSTNTSMYSVLPRWMAIGSPFPCCMLHCILYILILLLLGGIIICISFCLYLFVYISTINQSNRVTICTGVTSQLIVTLGWGMLNWTNADRFCHCALSTVSLCHCSCLLAVCVSLCLYNPWYPLFDSYREIITMTILSPEYEYPYEIINHGGFDPQIGENLPRYFPSPFSSVIHTPHYH